MIKLIFPNLSHSLCLYRNSSSLKIIVRGGKLKGLFKMLSNSDSLKLCVQYTRLENDHH